MSTLTPFMQRLSIIVKQAEEEARNRAFCAKVLREPKVLSEPQAPAIPKACQEDYKEEIEWII